MPTIPGADNWREEAISRNPNFLTAYRQLALSYVGQWQSQPSPAGQTLEQAVAAIQRTLALNDALPWNYLVVGSLSLYQQQYEQALADVERSMFLAPTTDLVCRSAFCILRLSVCPRRLLKADSCSPLVTEGFDTKD